MGTEVKRCIIVAAGPSGCRWIERVKKNALVICADAGYLKAPELGLVPDLVVGDFDSSQPPRGIETVEVDREKDDTDTLLAVKEGLKRGCREFIVAGGMGARLDHTLANISALEYIINRGGRGWLVSDETALTVFGDGQLKFQSDIGTGVSVFAWGGAAHGVTLKGLKYPLFDYEMSTEFPIGVSNESIDKNIQITVKKGILLVTISPVGNTFIKDVYNGVESVM